MVVQLREAIRIRGIMITQRAPNNYQKLTIKLQDFLLYQKFVLFSHILQKTVGRSTNRVKSTANIHLVSILPTYF